MEMRAAGEVELSSDLTLAVLPIAAALQSHFLPSHCSSCFGPLSLTNPQTTSLLLRCCSAPLRYCSPACLAADASRHIHSGECSLLRHDQSAGTDLRVALRLLYSFEAAGVARGDWLDRVGGLTTGGDWEEGEEEEVREGGKTMTWARGRRGEGSCGAGLEEAVLRAVMRNGVEVHSEERGSVGVAVYGPDFSWFNHSCSPNACYRFEFSGPPSPVSAHSDGICGSVLQRVHAVATAGGEGDAALKYWSANKSKLDPGLSTYGPRIIIRSIKPIKKGEEVCVAYTDLMQPKAIRRMDLWSKYRFICYCSRCEANPESYVDRVMCENANADFDEDTSKIPDDRYSEEMSELFNVVHQVIAEYLLVGDTKSCCEKIESLLFRGFQIEQLQLEQSNSKFKLQPLHHISLAAYITLASTYKIRMIKSLEAPSDTGDGTSVDELEMRKAAAAFSLLIAGATNHLFLSEMSLIGSAAVFWIDAGDSLLGLAKRLVPNSKVRLVNQFEFDCLFPSPQGASVTQCTFIEGDFSATSRALLFCVMSITSKVWPHLTTSISCLRAIKSPVDFRWTGRNRDVLQLLGYQENPKTSVNHSCIGCKCTVHFSIDEERKLQYQLAIHCLVYGGYLARICYGRYCSLIRKIRDIVSEDDSTFGPVLLE